MFFLKEDYHYKIFKHTKEHMKRDAIHEYQGIHTGSRASQRPLGSPMGFFLGSSLSQPLRRPTILMLVIFFFFLLTIALPV